MIDRFRTIKHLGNGFSLIEMMVYLAIFMVVSVASVTFLLSLDEFINQYRMETALYRSGTDVMEQVLLAVRQADQVDLLNTIQDSPSTGKLTVENSATTTTFTLDGGGIDLSINGYDYGDLTSGLVNVDGFTVYQYPLAVGEFVRVRLDMTATLDASTSKSVIFYGGAVVRGAI